MFLFKISSEISFDNKAAGTPSPSNIPNPDEEIPSGQYNRSDSIVYKKAHPEFKNYKLPKMIDISISMTVLQNGLPIISSQHFGFTVKDKSGKSIYSDAGVPKTPGE